MGLNRKNRRYQQAVNNQYGNHARKTVSSQNANRHQITKGFRHTVISHLSTFICSKLNGLKVYQLLHVDYVLYQCGKMLEKKFKKILAGRSHEDKKQTTQRCFFRDSSFNRCLESWNFMFFALQRDSHQQIKDVLRSVET